MKFKLKKIIILSIFISITILINFCVTKYFIINSILNINTDKNSELNITRVNYDKNIKTYLKQIHNLKKDLEKQKINLDSLLSSINIPNYNLNRNDSAPKALGGSEKANFEKFLLKNIKYEFSTIKQDIENQDQNLKKIDSLIQTRKQIFDYTPTIWPVDGWISSFFGHRISPFTGKNIFHEGIDISAWPGTEISSTARGTVKFAGKKGSYGNLIIIKHKYGFSTAYGHCKKILVKRNQKVLKGDVIGLVGSTGRSTGAHCHYEVRINGIPVNPSPYLVYYKK